MARPGVTREQVFEAAEAIVAEDQSPTIVAVRSRLGGGSPNTIAPLLAEWREANENRKVETLPPLPEPVEAAMRQVWGTAWKSAQGQLEAEREALLTARKEIEKERAEMLGEIGRLDAELEAAREETQQVRSELDAERQAHAQTQAEARETRVLAEERGKRVEAQEAELKELRRQAAEASATVGRLEGDIAHLRESHDAAEARVRKEAEARAAVEHERDRAQGDNTRLGSDLEAARETARQAKTTLDLSGKKIHKLEGELETARQAQVTAEKALAELRVEVATLKERAAHVDELRTLIQRLQPGEQDD